MMNLSDSVAGEQEDHGGKSSQDITGSDADVCRYASTEAGRGLGRSSRLYDEQSRLACRPSADSMTTAAKTTG